MLMTPTKDSVKSNEDFHWSKTDGDCTNIEHLADVKALPSVIAKNYRLEANYFRKM